ncbi:hypothetical protein D3C85_1843390 [compost metagenome]
MLLKDRYEVLFTEIFLADEQMGCFLTFGVQTATGRQRLLRKVALLAPVKILSNFGV